MADQWVEDIDAARYAEFLERAYDVVYRELVDADAVKPPDGWLTHLKGKAHRPWDLSRTCEFAAEMYRLKLEGRGKPKVWGQTLSRFVLSHIKERFGPGNYRKQLSGFVQRILQVVEAPPEDPAIFAWLLLFAQLAGFHSRSSRLPALPPAAEQYVLDTLAASAELISEDDPTYSLRACMEKPGHKALVGHVRADAAKKLYASGRATLARTQRRKPRGADARRDRAILFLVKLGDNGVLWNVLSFWRATD